MSPLRWLMSLIAAFCVASFLAQLGVAGVLWYRGQFTPTTVQGLLAVAYDVPVRELYDRLLASAMPEKREMVSFEEVQEARMLQSLDLDLREMFVDKGAVELRELAVLLNQDRGRYTQLKSKFDQEWADMQQGLSNSALRDLQRQIESLQPKAAKDQLLRILDSKELPPDQALNQVVTLFKSLNLDKRKKIVAEFKDADAPRLQEILRQIRLGQPEANLLRDTRKRLEQMRLQE